jgi:hypothetical protein
VRALGNRNVVDWADLGVPVDYSDQGSAVRAIREAVLTVRPRDLADALAATAAAPLVGLEVGSRGEHQLAAIVEEVAGCR